MNTVQILNYVTPYQRDHVFKGVFACNTLPKKKITLPAIFIVNLSAHSEIGTHWIGVYIDQNSNCFYFDSFGLPPKNNYIVDFIRKHAKRIYYNRQQVQHIISTKCGHYCCLFAVSILKFHTIDMYIRKFSLNLFVNEILVEKMFDHFKEK